MHQRLYMHNISFGFNLGKILKWEGGTLSSSRSFSTNHMCDFRKVL